MVVWKTLVGVVNFIVGIGDEEDEPQMTPKNKTENFQMKRRCSYCGREVHESMLAYSNGYAVCHSCHRPNATNNYWGTSAW